MNRQDDKPPATWNDETAIEADMKLWLQSQIVEHDESVLKAFRAGWKAGAMQTAANMWHWIRRVVFGHSETDQHIERADKDGKEGKK